MHACGATGNLRVIRTNDFFGVCICWVSLDHGLVTTHRSGLDADLTSTTRAGPAGAGSALISQMRCQCQRGYASNLGYAAAPSRAQSARRAELSCTRGHSLLEVWLIA